MKDEDIKKIFTVAWVKERKILVGTITTIIVAGLIFFIVSREVRQVCFASALEIADYCIDDLGIGLEDCLDSAINLETSADDEPLCFLKDDF